MRVLFADDQIPDDSIPDREIVQRMLERYGTKNAPFANAFVVMRRAKESVSEDHQITVARTHAEALTLASNQEFDAAIIDLGWAGDLSVPEQERRAAGWRIADAIEAADALSPDRIPTALIMYSARFGSHPDLAERAASKGRLPIAKPYEERATIPLDTLPREGEGKDRIDAACESLRATLSFIEQQRESRISLLDIQLKNLEVLRRTATEGVARAGKRAGQWDDLTRVFLSLSIVIVLAGVVGMLFLGVAQGSATAAVGIVVGLIPRLMYGELHKARAEIQLAYQNLITLTEQARSLSEGPHRPHAPPNGHTGTGPLAADST
jgi:CheY-like chemotaxis protein